MAFSAAQFEALVTTPEVTPGGMKNRIINGQFDIWQRGPGPFTTIPTLPSGGKYTADRWVFGGGDGGGTRTSFVEQRTFVVGQTDVPGNPTFYLDYQNFVTGGDSNENSVIIQRIEDVRLLNGSEATVSFWAKADTAGPHVIAVHFRQFFGGFGGSVANVLPGQEITLTDMWIRYTLTFDILNIFGKTIGSAGDDSLRLRFVNQAGVSAAGALNLPNPVNFTGVLSLANVQLEKGDEATDYEDRDIGLELTMCQRFYEINDRSETSFSGGGAHNMWMNFKVTKRVLPSVTFNVREDPPTTSNVVPGSASIGNQTLDGFRLLYNVVTGNANTHIRTEELPPGPGVMPGQGLSGLAYITGHDPDFHASLPPLANPVGAQVQIQTAINFIMDPALNRFIHKGLTKFLFVESMIAPPPGHRAGVAGIIASGFALGVDFDHHDASTLVSALGQLGTTYAGLVVASDFGCILTQAELDILNANAAAIATFMNNGGGIFALPESNGGTALTPSGGQYNWLPFSVGDVVLNQAGPFSLTTYGTGLGLTNPDMNGDSTHVYFSGFNSVLVNAIVDNDASVRPTGFAARFSDIAPWVADAEI